MKVKLFFISFVLLLFTSCMSPVDELKPYGETALIYCHGDNNAITGELIYINDSTLVYSVNNNFISSKLDSIDKIYITDYKVTTKNIVLLTSLLLDGFFIASGFRENSSPMYSILGVIHAIATIFEIGDNDPEVNFIYPFTEEKIHKLKLYCRYPRWQPQLN